jgi:hypothetical protein
MVKWSKKLEWSNFQKRTHNCVFNSSGELYVYKLNLYEWVLKQLLLKPKFGFTCVATQTSQLLLPPISFLQFSRGQTEEKMRYQKKGSILKK